jgi:hypothetical protein
MRALKFFGLGFATAVLLFVAAAFGFRSWFTARFREDRAQWRQIPIGFVVQDDDGIPALIKQGAYSHVSQDINAKNFPLPRADAHIANMGLFTVQQDTDTSTVLASIKARQEGAPRPAKVDECLQYGAYIAALKSRHLFSSDRVVVCLGQSATVKGACVVPQLWSVDYGLWNLGTAACDGPRTAGTEFLVVNTRPPSRPRPR